MQSGDSFEFALRLCGHASIWQECSKFVMDKEAGILQFPAKVGTTATFPIQLNKQASTVLLSVQQVGSRPTVVS